MDKKLKAALESYARHLLGALLTAVVIVGGGDSPLSFSSEQWGQVANAIWAAIIPVAIRWANKKDPAFGRVVESVAKEVPTIVSTTRKKSTKK